MSRFTTLLIILHLSAVTTALPAEEHPLPEIQRTEFKKQFDKIIQDTTQAIPNEPENVNLYSRRGDAHFFQGQFQKAIADYEKMVELKPALETSHWRRGIAYFYSGEYKKAAHQFEIYDTFDNVDRENGIWRFFSQTKAYGLKKAREGLLKYEKDDREPFPSVYKLFEGKISPETILEGIRSAEISDVEREKRYFYAYLYIGLNDAIEGKTGEARTHLRHAVANAWGPKAGFGPNYMWHVGRLHYEMLLRKKK